MLKLKRIGLIITKEEKRFVIKLAGIEGMFSHLSLIRRLIHKAAEQQGLSNPSDAALELKFALSEVSPVDKTIYVKGK